MENASKALIIAGSILISLIIIVALKLTYDSIRDYKSQEQTSGDIEKLSEYNNKIEKYNTQGLYGSEIMSLVNLIEDYNKLQGNDIKGYKPIDFNIQINPIVSGNYFTKRNYTRSELNTTYKSLENKLETVKSKKYANGKTIEYFAGLRTNELEILKNSDNYKNNSEIQNIEVDINTYTDLKSELTQFKNKRFSSPDVKYDAYNGRIKSMSYTEI